MKFILILRKSSFFLKISCAMMDGQCSTDDWIGSDVGPPKGNIQLTIDWFVLIKSYFA